MSSRPCFAISNKAMSSSLYSGRILNRSMIRFLTPRAIRFSIVDHIWDETVCSLAGHTPPFDLHDLMD